MIDEIYKYAPFDFDVFNLLSNGATVLENLKSISPLYQATQMGDVEMLKILVLQGGNVNSKFKKDTLLTIATDHGHAETVRLLLSKKAEIDSIGSEEVTPLYLACQNGLYEIAKALIEKKANVNFLAPDDATPLSICCLLSTYKNSSIIN